MHIYTLLLSLKLPSAILFPSPLKAVSGLKNTETIELEGHLVLLSVAVQGLLLLSL